MAGQQREKELQDGILAVPSDALVDAYDSLSERTISDQLPQTDDNLSERTISDKLPQEENEKQEPEISSGKKLSSTPDKTQKPVVESGVGNSRGQKRKASGQLITGSNSPNDTSIGREMVRKLRSRKVYRSPNFLYYGEKERDIDFILGLEERKPRRKPARSSGGSTSSAPCKRGRPAGSKKGRRSDSVGMTVKDPISPARDMESEVKNQSEEEAQASEAFVPSKEDDSNNNSEGKSTKKNKVSEGRLGEALVGAKIKVWWPLDKKFYKGVVDSYDHSTKNHSILYDDGDKEVLLMEEECWQLLKLPRKVRSYATTSGYPNMSMVGFI